jgi:hypothetical protein
MFRAESERLLAQFEDPEMLAWALKEIDELPYTNNETYIEEAKRVVQRICLRIEAKRAVQQAQVDEEKARFEAFCNMQTKGVH